VKLNPLVDHPSHLEVLQLATEYSSNPLKLVPMVEAFKSAKEPLSIFFCLVVEIADLADAIVAMVLEITASSLVAANLGMAILESIPMTTMTKTSSIMVKALRLV